MPEPICWYMDEHVPPAVTAALRRNGIDVATVQELNLTGAEDIDHVRNALKQGRAIFTQDADFLRIAVSGEPHAGIVYAHQHTHIGAIVSGLLLISEVYTAEDMSNRIEYRHYWKDLNLQHSMYRVFHTRKYMVS